MKRLYFLALSAFFMIVTTAEVAACWGRIWWSTNSGSGNGSGGGGVEAVGAPLDGGLLALLAAAGVTYFVARRKKKKNKE